MLPDIVVGPGADLNVFYSPVWEAAEHIPLLFVLGDGMIWRGDLSCALAKC